MSTVQELINQSADKYKIPRDVYTALIFSEYDPRQWTSSAGARGFAQLMPDTAKSLGVANIDDPAQNIDAGALYLRQLLDKYNGNLTTAISKYKGIKTAPNLNGAPDSTTYSNAKILERYTMLLDSVRAKKFDLGFNVEAVAPITNDAIAQEAQAKRDRTTTQKITDSLGITNTTAPASTSSWDDFLIRAKNPQFIFTLFVCITMFIFGLYTLTIKATA